MPEKTVEGAVVRACGTERSLTASTFGCSAEWQRDARLVRHPGESHEDLDDVDLLLGRGVDEALVTPQPILARHRALVYRRCADPDRRQGRPTLRDETVDLICFLPGSVTATLHSVDERKDEASGEGVEIDRAW